MPAAAAAGPRGPRMNQDRGEPTRLAELLAESIVASTRGTGGSGA